MDLYYYTFVLNGEERFFHTYVPNEFNDNEIGILLWAERFGFLKYEDFSECTNIRQIPQEEVDRRYKEIYAKWWSEHINDNVYLYQQIIHKVYLEGVIDTIDEQKVIVFYHLESLSPGQLVLPEEYDFEDGENVNCLLKVYNFIEITFFKIISIELGRR